MPKMRMKGNGRNEVRSKMLKESKDDELRLNQQRVARRSGQQTEAVTIRSRHH